MFLASVTPWCGPLHCPVSDGAPARYTTEGPSFSGCPWTPPSQSAKEKGLVYSWGVGAHGRLGHGSETTLWAPKPGPRRAGLGFT